MAQLTEKERAMLTAIRDSEYHDGASPIDNPVWVDCAMAPFGAAAGGIMASLVKKGLAETDGECCCITVAGFRAIMTGDDPVEEREAAERAYGRSR